MKKNSIKYLALLAMLPINALMMALSSCSEKENVEPDDNTVPSNCITVVANGVKFRMIKVEAGTFQMGQGGDSSEVHQVTLTNDYYIGETEVTQQLWTAVMGFNPSSITDSNQFPVESVSWAGCNMFIKELNEITGRSFRLPTEAEWEFAARGGNASEGYAYSGSNTIDDVAWYYDNSSLKIHDVATKAPNELGIYDMSGNVWEWCQDKYHSYSDSDVLDPSYWPLWVIRGGCWGSYAHGCHVAYRAGHDGSNSSNGFRLAL